MYSVVTPMLNPFIYSLRNKDLVGALRKLFWGKPWNTSFARSICGPGALNHRSKHCFCFDFFFCLFVFEFWFLLLSLLYWFFQTN
jgi:hypothetical protein